MEGGIVMKGKEILKHQRGMTLVETVAVLVIIGFLSLLLLNTLTGSSSQYSDQLQENTQIHDISYVLKVVTKEIRMTNATNIEEIDNGIRFKNTNTNYQLDTTTHSIYKYIGDNNTFDDDDEVVANHIHTFNIKKINPSAQGSNTEWHILIQDNHDKKIETTIFSRS